MNPRKLFAWCVFAIPIGLMLWWFWWSWECALADWHWTTRNGRIVNFGSAMASVVGSMLSIVAGGAVAVVSIVRFGPSVADGLFTLSDWAREPWRKDDPGKPRTF